MAEGIRYVCSSCGKTIEVWSDGNPYYIDGHGKKKYAYHPDHENLARCIGNDFPHLCLNCGEKFKVDSRNPVKACPYCGDHKIVPTFNLYGKKCPNYKRGIFLQDQDFHKIS